MTYAIANPMTFMLINGYACIYVCVLVICDWSKTHGKYIYIYVKLMKSEALIHDKLF